MTTLTMLDVLWTIAGFVVGYVGFDFTARVMKLTSPLLFRIAIGLVFSLAAYTYLLPTLR